MNAELLALILVVSAFMSVYFEEAVYSVVALACVFVATAALYATNGAVLAAVFQLALGSGALAVLFLSGEMLAEKTLGKKRGRDKLLALLASVLLSLPSVFLSVIKVPSKLSPDFSLSQAIWGLRALDVVLQGLVVITVALGVVILLHGGEGR